MADDNETASAGRVEQNGEDTTNGSSLAALGPLNGPVKHAIGELRQLLYCKVCIRPMYEPYTVACGHTFCYSCLSQWFESHRSNKTCPECRAPVWRQPGPAYALREIVQLFLKTQEFLSEDDDIQDHERARQEEASQVEKDRAERKLFGNSFGVPLVTSHPVHRTGIVDHSDGVRRCPHCFWELEHGYCNNCGDDVGGEYDSELGYGNTFASPNGRSIPLTMDLRGVEDWSVNSSDSEYDSEDIAGEMDDFIEDDIHVYHGEPENLSDVDSLDLARQRLNSTGSAYSASSNHSPRTPNHTRSRLRRGGSEPTGGLTGRRQINESSSEESSSESEAASTGTEGRHWPMASRDHTPQRVNFALDPISSDEADEMAAAAALPARPARKRRRVVADDSDEDAASPLPESSSTPGRRGRDQSPDHRDPDPDSDGEAEDPPRDPSPANSESWETESSHARECAMHPSNRRRTRTSNRGPPPVALSRFSRRGRRQVADD